MTNILVTGGVGFIFSHETPELMKRANNVIVLDNLSGGFRDNISKGIDSFQSNNIVVALVMQFFGVVELIDINSGEKKYVAGSTQTLMFSINNRSGFTVSLQGTVPLTIQS